jgi:casein kinase II subunit beta
MKWLRMRPTDVTELDETRRYWEEHDEDADRPDDDDLNMVDVAEGGKGAPVDRRKKAIRTRRRPTNGSNAGGGSPMDTNGVGAAAG